MKNYELRMKKYSPQVQTEVLFLWGLVKKSPFRDEMSVETHIPTTIRRDVACNVSQKLKTIFHYKKITIFAK